MAYLRSIEAKCKTCKTRRATVELVDRWNSTRGEYCAGCGQRALKAQNLNENPDREPDEVG